MESVEAMEKLNELLPGIEEFLVQILPQEKLSPVAEERRQYFVERLDILRLPPSLPPRAGKRLSVELLEESEEQCGIPADQVPELGSILVPDGALEGAQGTLSEAEKDFAAEQRKISRNMVASVSSEKDAEDTEESDSAKGVKVYDDIDPTESIKSTDRDDEDDDDINALYEIPVARQPQPPASEENSLSQPADISSMATAGSIDDISDDVLDATAPAWQPPPLPPRTKKKESESTESRVSSNSLDGSSKPPELPFRPPLPRRNEVHYARSEKSDKSEKSEKSDVSDGDSTSYESFDENEHDTELMSKLNVKLPKRPKKKSKTSAKLLSSKARSSSTWEINVPFKKLDNIVLSGEMLHKGKLSWNRRLVAISNGCMALYKPDKETRPVFVIPLAGFSAYLGEPLGRKGFEMKMTHENGEAYTFAVDFKEWVSLWCEHINGLSQGLSVPSYHQHLVRTFSGGSDQATFGSKRDAEGNLSNSNLSLSSDGVESDDSSKPRLRANKVMRMGSFAYRATQFFENLGKKTTSKRKVSSLSSPADVTEYNMRDGIQEESSLSSASIGGPAVSPSSEATSPVFEDSFRNSSAFSSPSSMEFPPLPPTPPPSIPTNIKHQGYLNIFSSFNKRRWGQRWCLVRENMFECYRNQTSQPCELNFLLKNCVLRQALVETNSPLSLMLLENNREKITVEPPSKEELSQWLRVLMMETATESVPPGLEEFFVEVDDNQVEDLTAALEAEYSDIVGASVLKSWEVGSVPILPSKDKAAEDTADDPNNPAADQGSKEDSPDHDDASTDQADSSPPDKYLYSTVIKRPSFAALEQLDDKGDSQQEEAVAQQQPEDSKVPCFKDNLAVYNAHKNTTDSGFYSVKETNSDSESGSDVKTDSVSPTQESPLSASAEDRGSSVCETPDPKVSDSGGASEKEPVLEEEDEEESALEKTMTSEDFKENLDSEKTTMSENVQDGGDGGQDAVCSASSALNVEPAGEENNGCENHRQDSKAEGDVSVPSAKDKDSASGGVTKENHEHSEKVDSQLANSEEVQQQDKPKKKKKKGKGKKNKQKQQETSEKSSVDKVASSTKSQSKPASDNPEASRIPGCGPSTVDEGAEGSQSSAHRQLHSGACQSSSVSAPGPEGGEGDRVRGPDEDEMIVDLKERIGKLREKLVQIKRKRIAVRDKRVRAFSAEERNACDKEYLVLESECKETAAIIQTLEEELRAASASAANKS